MSTFPQTYIGFVYGTNSSNQNLYSTTWVIYSPTDESVSNHGICLDRTTRNIEEYNVVIEILFDAITFGIRQFIVRLDSQLVVLNLNGVYSVRSASMLRMFLRVCLLEQEFDYIEYQHIPRNLNKLTNALVNYLLNWHL